ncbi:GNAT family N-acetyltransferase [Lutispora sp.]|uniref:GNAT family N-acetyltransferase n=1 Tax=Lutispora sp. TaxID=2828727 RepID=UPI002B205A66|nr:GNAT family protein [Lutispora sp.]MEA4960294.1 GNAT family protein [Lutispora sp.]
MRNMLIGDNIRLGSLNASDMEYVSSWFNDVEFLRYYDMVPAIPKSQKDMLKLLEYYESSEDKQIFAVRLIHSNTIIGIAGFDDILWSNGVATTFIGIGSKESKGKGLGKETMRLLLDFGFNELNFHRIQLNVISYNSTAISLYESVGFKKEGTYREFIYRDGKRYDLYLYGILKEEYAG